MGHVAFGFFQTIFQRHNAIYGLVRIKLKANIGARQAH
jgi:hypothetical protein